MLNAEGTAFEFTTVKKTVTPLTSYFTSLLTAEESPAVIELPKLEVLKEELYDSENATAILNPGSVTKTEKTNKVYDLSGRRISNGQMSNVKKGLYIINEKKVFIK